MNLKALIYPHHPKSTGSELEFQEPDSYQHYEGGLPESETAVDHERRTVHASRLLLWYQGDFGGSRQIKMLLARVLGMPRIVSYRLRWQPYDWTPIV